MPYRMVKCRWDTGEHYRILVDENTGVPPVWPTLYITTELRNTGKSVATMEAALGAIQVLLRYTEAKAIDLTERVLKREFLALHEVDALCDEARKVQGKHAQGKGKTATVSPMHLYNRLSRIAAYLEWLAQAVLDNRRTREDDESIKKLVDKVLSRRPEQASDEEDVLDRGLSDAAFARLMEVVEPTHPSNPFLNARVAERNALAIHMLAALGVRRGELLGVHVEDVNWEEQWIGIRKRPDDPRDPRMHQPRAKTLERDLPDLVNLLERIRVYVMGARRKTRGAKKHPFLLVGHGNDEDEGQPLSISGLNKAIEVLRGCDPLLEGLHAHALRHNWNWRFSTAMQAKPKSQRESPEEQESIRNRWMGWQPGSRSAKRYNKRFITEKARKAGLALQEDLNARVQKNGASSECKEHR